MSIDELGISNDGFSSFSLDYVKHRIHVVILEGSGLIHHVLSMLCYFFSPLKNLGFYESRGSRNKVVNWSGGITREKEFGLDP